MKEAKHTPGPWWVEGGDPNAPSWAGMWPNIHADGYEVVGAQGLYGDYDTDMANARLIAAAPDLLAALMMVLDDPQALDGRPRTAECVRAAIAKAIGE